MKILKNLTLIHLSLTILLSCDSVMPGGFWDEFEQDLQVEKQSDQGPWGGTRTYYWKSKTNGYFSRKKVLDFTSSNGWSFIDSTLYHEQELKNWRHEGKPCFTVQVGPFEPSSDDRFLEQDFPRWTSTDVTLLRFKTGWLIFYPGADNSTEVNGFITLSVDGREMTVYHLWGE